MKASGVLTIGPWWHRLARWGVTVVSPSAPVVVLEPLSLEEDRLKLRWNVTDSYGLASLTAVTRPPGYNRALEEGATLPAATGAASATLDARESPYSGMTVAVTLQAANLAGVRAASQPQMVALPPLALHDPTAMVLGMIRRNLALRPEQGNSIAGEMMRVAEAPPSAISYAADAQLAMLATALATHSTDAEAAVRRLLLLMQQIEAGPDFGPSQALAQAVQKLLQALAHGPPDADTLSKLLAAMQQALAQHLAAAQATQPAQPGAAEF